MKQATMTTLKNFGGTHAHHSEVTYVREREKKIQLQR
jgi:hypothetical protein